MDYLVVDNDFNRANYPDLIGQVFKGHAPGYAAVEVLDTKTKKKKRKAKTKTS